MDSSLLNVLNFGLLYHDTQGFPGSSVVKNSPANTGDMGSIPGSRRSPWRRKWQPPPVFLPGKSHGQRSLAGCSPWCSQRVRRDLVAAQQQICSAPSSQSGPVTNVTWGTSLAVQWLRLRALSTGNMGSIPGWGIMIPRAASVGKKKK